MSECWANSLGNCSGKMSREHLITKGTFIDDEILVHGFDWCRDAPVKIPQPPISPITRQRSGSQLLIHDRKAATEIDYLMCFRLSGKSARYSINSA